MNLKGSKTKINLRNAFICEAIARCRYMYYAEKAHEEGKEDVLCRVHSKCLTGNALGSRRCDFGEQYNYAMRAIAEDCRGIDLVNKLRAYELQDKALDTVDANRALGFRDDMREYYEAYQMLKKLGIKSIRIMTNNPEKIKHLENYGLEIEERIPIQIEATEYDLFYLQTKKERMGHILD